MTEALAEVRELKSRLEKEKQRALQKLREANIRERKRIELPFSRPRDIGITKAIEGVETQASELAGATKEITIQEAPPEKTGEELFTELQGTGEIPENAIYIDYDSESGALSYEVPETRTGLELFYEMQKTGKISDWATFVGYNKETGELSYTLPEWDATKVFTQLKNEGKIPQDATLVSYNPVTREVSYSLASGQQAQYRPQPDISSFQTETGYDVVKMLDAGYTIGDLEEMGFDRASLEEVQNEVREFEEANVKLDTGEYVPRTDYNELTQTQKDLLKERGVEAYNQSLQEENLYVEISTMGGTIKVPLKEWEALSEIKQYEKVLGRPPTLEEWRSYRLQEAGIELPWYKTFMPGLPQLLGFVTEIVPGEQEEERWLEIQISAQEEWQRAYPELKWQGALISSAEQLGFTPVRAAYPQIAITDISGKEWAITAGNVALWTLPAWLPKAVRAVKTIRPTRLTARLATVPFSESPGLKRAPISTKAPTPRLTETLPYTREQYEAVGHALEQLRISKAMKVVETAKVNEPIKGPPAVEAAWAKGLEGKAWTEANVNAAWRAYQVRIPDVSTLIEPAKVKLPRVQPTFPSPAMRTGWITTAEGRLLPAGAKPIYLVDVPATGVLTRPAVVTKGGIVTVVPRAATELKITPSQLNGTVPLSIVQVQVLARALGKTETEVRTMAKSRTLAVELTRPETEATVLQELELLPVTQKQALAELATRTTISPEIRPVTDIRQSMQTQYRESLVTEPLTETRLRVQTVSLAPVATETGTKETTRRTYRIRRPEIEGDGIDIDKGIYPDGTTVWKMGAWWKIIPPNWGLRKPISSRLPPQGVTKLHGTPQETLTFVGGKIPYDNVAFDLGVVDGYIDVREQKIYFSGYGEETNVGTSIPENTKGVTLLEQEAEEMPMRPQQFAQRIQAHPIRKRVATQVSGVKAYLGRGLEYPYYMRRIRKNES